MTKTHCKFNLILGNVTAQNSVLVASWRNYCSTYSKSCNIQDWMIWKAMLTGSWLFTIPSPSTNLKSLAINYWCPVGIFGLYIYSVMWVVMKSERKRGIERTGYQVTNLIVGSVHEVARYRKIWITYKNLISRILWYPAFLRSWKCWILQLLLYTEKNQVVFHKKLAYEAFFSIFICMIWHFCVLLMNERYAFSFKTWLRNLCW